MRHRFNPWVGKILWRKEWLPTPVFLPGESHGQGSLVGYSPCGCKESDTFTFTSLKPGSLLPPACFSFSKLLWLLGMFCVFIKFKSFCSNSVENAIDNLIGIALNL